MPPRRAARIRHERRRRAVIAGSALAAIALAVALTLTFLSTSRSTGSTKAAVSAIQWTTAGGVGVYGPLGPEGVPQELGPALGAANAGLIGATIDRVACNRGEQVAYHHHVHLAMFVDGRPQSVPVGVGMVDPLVVQPSAAGDFAGSRTCFYWIHVHAQDGIIHLESPVGGTFVLGQLFAVWHQRLSPTALGRYSGAVRATVDGRAWNSDPARIPLVEHAQIVLDLGGPPVTPPPISWAGTGL